MSTETVDQDPILKEINEFTMPEAYMGMNVLWYPHAQKHHEPIPGRVVMVAQHCVDIVTEGDNMHHPSVHHIEDPRFRRHDHLKEDGGWAYTQQVADIQKIKSVAELLERSDLESLSTLGKTVSVLESEVAKLRSELHGMKVRLGRMSGKEGG